MNKAQAKVSKFIFSLRNKNFVDSLRESKLFSLENRRLLGQLIEMVKVFGKFDKVDHNPAFHLSEEVF